MPEKRREIALDNL